MRGFSYPFPRSLLEAWAVSFLKVQVTFWSLNQTVKQREGHAVLRCTRFAKFLANKAASPRLDMPSLLQETGPYDRVPSDLLSGRDGMGRGRVFVSVKDFSLNFTLDLVAATRVRTNFLD